jgi:hypothetical protein
VVSTFPHHLHCHRQDTALRSAVATANATELLDPALVDRFAVHL